MSKNINNVAKILTIKMYSNEKTIWEKLRFNEMHI